jgi:hypothetical protein
VGARGSAEHLLFIGVRPAALTPALSHREREQEAQRLLSREHREQEAQRLLSREHREQEALLLR